MVERSIDKKIRAIREILRAPASEILDSNGKPHTSKEVDTFKVKISHKSLMAFLDELKLTVSGRFEIPLFDDSENQIGESGDYLLGVIVE